MEQQEVGTPSPSDALPATANGKQARGTESSSAPIATDASSSSGSAAAEAAAATNMHVIRPPAPGSSYQSPPMSDDDLKPTAGELKRAFASVIAGRHGPDAPLMTKAMREREDAKYGVQRKMWSSVSSEEAYALIVAQEWLWPKDYAGSSAGLQQLYDSIRSGFAPEYTAKRFLLVQALPRRDFSPKDPALRGKSLADLGFAPAAMLQIRFQDEAMNSSSHPAPLKVDLLDKAQYLPPPKTYEDSSSRPAPSEQTAEGVQQQKTASGKPIPKWLLKGLSKK